MTDQRPDNETTRDETIRSVLVLGGGTAGFLAALALRIRTPDLTVRLIRSKDIGVIGVGEGTTAPITHHLHHFLNLDPKAFYAQVNPVWKLGIKFLWGPRDHFNFTFSPHMTLPSSLPRPMGFYLVDDMADACLESVLMDTDRAFHRNAANGLPFITRNHAYHMENESFVAYLERSARAVGVDIADDTVLSVDQDDRGVTALNLASGQRVSADLYVDASGFRGELIGKALDEPYVSYASTLFCDRAVIGGWQRGAGEVTQPYTVAETMDHGWAWRIDHEHFINRGYVYSSSFATDEQAEREFRAKNPRVAQTRIVKFRTGRRQRAWVKNVVAIGNATGFVEPLEATSIGTICSQTQHLVYALRIGHYRVGPHLVAAYNDRDARFWDAVRRFLAVHYKFNTRLDTPFWQAAREKTDLAGAETFTDFYRENGPDGTFGASLLDNIDQFGAEAYLTLLVGQRVPYRHPHDPTPAERNLLAQHRAKQRALAHNAYTVEQALKVVRLPQWTWTPGFFRG